MKQNIELRAQLNPYRRFVDVALFKEENGKFYQIKAIEWVEFNVGEVPERLCTLTDTNAMVLMHDLWDVGIRPEGSQSAEGELKATKYHLEDMRKLALQTIIVERKS